jgi:hypothetical protein
MWLVRPPYIFLILSAFFLCLGAVSTYTGKTWARYGRVVYSAEEPRQFWEVVAVYYLGSVWFIVYFLYKAHYFSS